MEQWDAISSATDVFGSTMPAALDRAALGCSLPRLLDAVRADFFHRVSVSVAEHDETNPLANQMTTPVRLTRQR